MNTNETAGVKPATDEEIFARLKELSARASDVLGAEARANAYWSYTQERGMWMVELCYGGAFGINKTFEAALSDADKQHRDQKRRGEIEARVRAEMEASA